MVGGHSIRPGLQLVGARFLNFHLGKHAGSPTRTVYVDVILTRSKVKVYVTDHLNFRQLPINAHFQVYLLRHFCVELKTDG